MSKVFLSIMVLFFTYITPGWSSNNDEFDNLTELERLDKLIHKAYKNRNCIEAGSYFSKTLETRMKVFGQTYENVLGGYEKIARCWRKKGDLETSLQLYNKLKELCDVIFYDNYYVLAAVHELLGEVYVEDKQYEKAFTSYEQALDYKLEIYGFDHEEIGHTYEGIADVLELMLKQQDAAGWYLKALIVYRKHYTYRHYRIANVVKKINAIQPEQQEVAQLWAMIQRDKKNRRKRRR